MKQIGIILILVLSSLLNFLCLGQEGLANLYYAAGVKSMLMNGHNFFFVSFDPGGFITIDKPPLGFWLQTLTAKVFGFQGWSIILPQALGGVLSVYLIYVLLKRYHGVWAGLIAAIVLALTPIFVAASRNNTIDVLLVTILLLAVRIFLPATEDLSLKKLLFAFLFIGIGFNVKSLEAFMILPAFYITYFLAKPGQWRKKAVHLLAATFVLIVSSLPWFIAVDSVPPEDRPYVGSSETNSELELATGYNGLGHFLGYGIRMPGRQGQIRNPGSPAGTPPGVNTANTANNPGGRPNLQQPNRQFGGETGLPGLFRLFNHQLGGQISWLLPFALIGLSVALYQLRKQMVPESTRLKLLFWGCWLLPQLVFFSIAQGAHRYYLVMMAPAIAALVGISYRTLADWLACTDKRRYLLPAALLATLGVQAFIVSGYTEWHSWMLPIVIGAGLLATLLLGLIARKCGEKLKASRAYYLVLTISFISMMIAPFAWSLTPVLYGSGNAAFPFAGPDLHPLSRPSNVQWGMNFSGLFTGFNDTNKLEAFLMTHSGGEKYLVAVPNAHFASPIILDTGQPVMTYGGFMGSEKILNEEKLEKLVADRQVRYILIGGTNNQQPEVNAWVSSHGTLVPDEAWSTPEQTNTTPANGGAASSRRMPVKLYDCRL